VNLRLRPLRVDDEAVVRVAQRELAADGFNFVFGPPAGQSWADYLTELEDQRRGRRVPAGRVESTFLVADVGGEVVGRSSLRHDLNEQLRLDGGHVGYGVRPAHRRRGYATEILRQSLVILRAIGVDRVLVTCDDDNIGSAAVIERCGGVLEDVVPASSTRNGKPIRRYWID
jgi:predicted acetyltransferase